MTTTCLSVQIIHCSINLAISSLQFSIPYHLNPFSWGRRDDNLKALNLLSIEDAVKLHTQWWRGSKNSQQNFMRQRYMLSFKDGTLLLREIVTMLGSKDVIYRAPASFWWFLCLMAYQLFLGSLMPKPFSYKNSSGTI